MKQDTLKIERFQHDVDWAMLNKLQQKQRTSSKTKSKKQVWDSWGVGCTSCTFETYRLPHGDIPLIVEAKDVTMFESTFGGP